MTKEEIRKFLDNTKVYVNGKSKEIQEKLFSFGYKWLGGNKVQFMEQPFLFISDDGRITHSNNMDFFKNCEETEITAEQILSLELTESFRPFKDKDECWNEMLKHMPFGWIREEQEYSQIQLVMNSGVKFIDIFFTFDKAVNYTFPDGTPFGIKE